MGTPAARMGDPIAHSNAMTGLLMGAALAAVVAVAVVATGGLAAVAAGALIAGGVAGGALAGEYIGAASMGPPTGAIANGSPNVLTNKIPSAMTNIAIAICAKEYGAPQPIAQGAATIFINQMNAARKGDKVVCGASVTAGSPNVYFDDATKTTLPIADEVPAWLNTTLQVVAVGAAVVGFGVAVLAVGWGAAILGTAGGLAGGWLGGKGGRALGEALGLSESATRALEVGGSLLGGMAGAKVATGLGSNPRGAPTKNANECQTNGCPISMHTGEELLALEDFVIAGPLSLSWTRFYRTAQSDIDEQLGHGWLTPLDEWVQLDTDGGIVYRDREGRSIQLPLPEPGSYGVNATEGLRVQREGDELRISGPGGPDRVFTLTAGRNALRGWVNDAGHRIDIETDSEGRACALRASWGRQWLISRAGGRIAVITPAWNTRGALVRYRYDTQGDLVAVLDRLDQGERYAYGGHLITRRTLATGFNFHFKWDAAGPAARCLRNWGDEGIYDYRFEWDAVSGRSRAIDSRGGCTEYLHNAAGHLLSITSPQGLTQSFRYDDFGLLVEAANPLGMTARHSYHPLLGLLATSADAAGHEHQFQHDAQGRLVLHTDPLGHAQRWHFDEHGRLQGQSDALGAGTSYDYNDQGLLARVTDALGRTRTLWWDEHARLVAEIGFDGVRRHFAYDDEDRVISSTAQDRRTQHYEWDAVGRLSGWRDASGAQTRLQYNAQGRLTHWVDTAGHVTEYRYREGLAQPSERIDPLGRVLRYSYDSERNLVALTNAKGEQHSLQWDLDERLVAQLGFDGREQHYAYDGAGRLAAHAQALGRAADGEPLWQMTKLQRDKLGRLIEKTTADGAISRYRYDALGRMVGADAGEHRVAFVHDAVGRLVEEHQGGARVAHTLDALGRRTATRLPDGQTLRYVWNPQGRLQALTLDGKPISRHAWNEFAEEAGREQGGVYSSYDYDPAGRLQSQTAAVKGSRRALLGRQYSHDAQGQVSRIGDLRHGTTSYFYDPAGQLLEVQGLTPERFAHDPAGNLLLAGTDDVAGYVNGNQLLMQGDRHYRYDAAGNRVEERSGKGGQRSVRYDYDAENRLAAVHSAQGSSRYHYDALGRRIAKTTPQGHTRFVWDGARLLGEASAAGEDHAPHSQRWYVYEPDSFRPLACIAGHEVYHYHLDHLGTPREMTNARGRIVWSARYRAWGALALADVDEVDNPLRFQGQYEDSESGLHYMQQRYYDPIAGRFLSVDPVVTNTKTGGHFNRYVYAENNPYKYTDPDGQAPHIALGAVIGGIAGAIGAARAPDASFGSVALGAAGGALAGAISAAAPVTGFAMLKGFVAGAAGNVVGQAVGSPGQVPSVSQAVAQGAVGALGAGVGQAAAAYTGIGLASATSQGVGTTVATAVSTAINVAMPTSAGGMKAPAPEPAPAANPAPKMPDKEIAK